MLIHFLALLFSTTALGRKLTIDVVNDITPGVKINRELTLKTTSILLQQALRLAAAPCNIVRVFTRK